jgi:hypothetical protein
MLKYIGNIINTILPSVLATVIGAYIVNHYVIANRPETPPAATASAPDNKKAEEPAAKNGSGEARQVMAPADSDAAKGKSEKADKAGARAPQTSAREKAAAEKSDKADKAEKADKADKIDKAEKSAPAKAAATPVASSNAAAVDTGSGKDERRDAADLARAAIERLRGSNEATRTGEPPRQLEVPRQQEPLRAEPQRLMAPPAPNTVAVAAPTVPAQTVPAPVVAPVQSAAPMSSVAPMVPPAPAAAPVITSSVPTPPEAIAAPPHREEARRPTPPAEIPGGRQSDGDASRSVGDDVLSAAQSVIHAVIPR